ncbi:uncharacterized protein LOC129608229 isoform X2 [Condylostylus longicornis]|nr:uncharacterized protein LOC129608229 isoform X2 [Condylostylus longicornis]XP_055375570.1 uncharacterized protein LOC129608229 isoform X2 [Condylostylus longicornis]XP_055375571.1 uncharacterized protein LOC129608229 isoform X2 [Condylostylus longicornis]
MDGTYFTRDNIQVHTIYFENIPDKNNVIHELEEYFSKYGKLSKIEIEKRYKNFSNDLRISGIVQYETPESAYRALKEEQNNNFTVLPADSWIQPTFLTKKPGVDDEAENYCSLVDLGEDLLMLIYSELTFRDIITLFSIFPNLRPSIRRYYKRVKSIKLNYNEISNLTLLEIRQFLIEIAGVIEDLEILDWNYNVKSIRLINFALHFCNVRSLHISSISFKDKDFSARIRQKFTKLEKLRLVDCRISDEDVQNLCELNLTTLDLSGTNNSFVGNYLHKFGKLKELSLENCEDLSPDNLEKMNFKNLEVLNICGCVFVNNTFKVIAENAHNLKSLKISISKLENNQFENFVGQIKSLEKLIIVNSSRTGCTGFYIDISNMNNRIKKLAESEFLQRNLHLLHLIDFKISDDSFEHLAKLKNLCEIMICFSHEENVSQEFWKLLCSLKKLKVLAMKMDGFKSFESSFMIKLIEYISKNRNRGFTLIAEISKSVYRDILKSSVYLQYKDIIKLVPFYFTQPYSHHALSEN